MSLSARRAVRDDERAVQALLGSDTLPFINKFGRFSLTNIMYDRDCSAGWLWTDGVCSETSLLSVCVLDAENNVVAFASFLDAPPVTTRTLRCLLTALMCC